MKNKFKTFLLLVNIFLLNVSILNANERFNFDITEIEILEDGNKFVGKKRGLITTDDNVKIKANEFEYNKLSNILELKGNVIIDDVNKNLKIFSEEIIYYKNKELYISKRDSKFINKEMIIESDNMKYDKFLNSINASGNAKIEDKENQYTIYANDITYLRNIEKVFTKGKTEGIIESKYDFSSYDVELLRNKSILSSQNKSTIVDKNFKLYELDAFRFFIKDEILKAKNLIITSDSSVPLGQSDIVKFDNGFFNLKEESYTASKTEVNLRKDTFDEDNNDPRIIGASSNSKNQITTVNNGVFTSCQKRDGKCPPWSIQAKKIIHDRNKKQLIYDHAILRVYDKPVMYFPKFFHPDPSVKRQSGFLKPQLNNSDILGTSIYVPYFHVISKNQDYTFKPTWFDNDITMLQSEYRIENKNSSFIADFSLTKGYKSSLSDNKNSISHLFTKYNLDLGLVNFDSSNLDIFVEKVSNDTYLKVFDTNLTETPIKPLNSSVLNSGFKLNLDHENYYFDIGANAYENLTISKSSDRFQFILPYYNFSKNIEISDKVAFEFNSSGSNNLIETNNLESNVINNLNYKLIDKISDLGIKNNFGIYFKNLNTAGKNNDKYKSSLQVELMNMLEFNSSLPLGKTDSKYEYLLEPKVSLRYNPGDMKNYTSTKRIINTDNVFDINRLGLSDSFEGGQSLTMGVNYKKANLDDINRYFETKISTVIRDKKQNLIPQSSTINNKNSNLFGSITYNHDNHFKFDYDFAIDNDLSTFNYNTISSEFTYENFTTEIKFIEERDIIGDSNSIENRFEYELDENNFLSFNTRRNRTINLTEYYDLLYEYKNDCLTAGFKYKKTYYQDRDLKPVEDLLLTVTFYPLTTYEQEIDQDLYRGDNGF
jgi:LPS-assembly protein